MLFTAFTDTNLAVDDVIVEDDKVVARWTLQATHKGPLRNILPKDKKIILTGIAI